MTATPAGIPSPGERPLDFLRALFDAAVARAQPANCIAAQLPAPPAGRTVVIGAGKAAAAMADAVDALWPADAALSGLVVTRNGHRPPVAGSAKASRIEVVEAAHPVPDETGRQAALRILDRVRGLAAQDLVLCLLSGGGSALLSLPLDGVDLADKQALNRALLASGATIAEINCVRKHLSAVKGGRLVLACAPARVVSLLISDVPGDDPAVIASGPTVPDPSSCADALEVLRRYRIDPPPAVRAGLESGAFETPKPGDPRLRASEVRMIATPREALLAAAEAARAAGIDCHLLSDAIEGESREAGKVHAAIARAVAAHGQPFARPCVIVSGGETTVTVRNDQGRGGRASEFLLGCAIALQGAPGIWGLAADTDGIDGVEDNAGAVIGPDTLARAEAHRLSPQGCLDRNDAYTFFAGLGDLVVTGPTFTNVNDFRALLVL